MSKRKPISEAHKLAISRARTGHPGHWRGKTLSPDHRSNISTGGKGKTYSPQAIASFRQRRPSEETCRKIAEAQRGEKSAAWKGGRSSPLVLARGRARAWRRRVLVRDGHRCRKCATTLKPQAHHIEDFRTHPELRYDVNNGITLCFDCHREEERLIRAAKKAQGNLFSESN